MKMEALDGLDPKVKFWLYRFSVWCCLLIALGNIFTFNIWGHIFPPPDPTWSAEKVAAFFLAHRTSLLWSVVLMGFIAPFFYFWAVITSIQMRRCEGGMGLLSLVQLTSGVVAPTGWCYPMSMLAVAVYRPERSPELIRMISDQFYLTFLGVAFIFSINIISLGLAAILDRRAEPVFPRWWGWANIILALIFAPGIFVYANMTGPFAWNGVYALWAPSMAGIALNVLQIWGLLRAIKSEEREEAAALQAR